MLSIEIDGTPLDLSEDFSATFNFKSPLFNSIGDYSFPFKIPATPKNVGLLNWQHRIENNNDPNIYIPGTILYNGDPFFEGTIRIKKADKTTYEGSLFIEKGNFNWEIKDKLLTDIDLGKMEFANENEVLAYANDSLDRLYPLEPIAFPEIYNEYYFDPPTEDPALLWYNKMSMVTGTLSLFTAEGARSLLVPNLYIKYVLDKVAEGYGYTIMDEFFGTSESLKQLALYTSYSINNRYWFINTIYFNLLVPKVKISKLITDLENLFNCSFLVSAKFRQIRIVSRKTVLLDPDYIEFSTNIMDFRVEPETKKNGFVFTMETDDGDKVMEEKLAGQSDTEELIQGAVEFFTDLPPQPLSTLGDIRYVISENAWYQLNVVNYMIGWRIVDMTALFPTKFYYKSLDDNNKVETSLSTILAWVYAGHVGNLGADYRDIKQRLFFIRRLQLFGEKFTHTYAMNWTEQNALTWGGTTGLFATYWKDWCDWQLYCRKAVSFSKQMNHHEIKDFDFTKKVMIDGTRYLVSELQVVLKLNSISTAKLKAFTCS